MEGADYPNTSDYVSYVTVTSAKYRLSSLMTPNVDTADKPRTQQPPELSELSALGGCLILGGCVLESMCVF